jgi:hypothetical protein
LSVETTARPAPHAQHDESDTWVKRAAVGEMAARRSRIEAALIFVIQIARRESYGASPNGTRVAEGDRG